MPNYNAALSYDVARAWDGVPTGFGRYELYVDWNNDGDFSDANEDITDDVLEITCKRGRDFASQLTGKAVAGTMEVSLRNDAGKYSPFNASSALAGSLLPNRKIQLKTSLPTATTIWTGYIEQIQPEVQKGAYTTAKIHALGIFKKFATTDVSVPKQTSIRTGAAIGAVLDAASWGASDRTIDTGETTITRFHFDGGKVLTALRQIEATESGFIRETTDGKIEFEDRRHRLTATASKTSQATFADDGTGFSYMGVRQEDAMSLVYNEFRCSVSTYTVGSLAALWTHPLASTSGTAPLIKAAEAITIRAEYPNITSASNVVGVDTWTTPVATTDYLANAASNGTGTNYTSSLNIGVSKASKTMEITITNNASVDVYLTKLQARGTPITISDPFTIKAEDSTSQTTYGVRTFPRPVEAKWVPTQEEAKSWCLQNLGAHKDPTPVMQLAFNANKSGDTLTQALTRDISDRITVKASTNAKLGINRDFYIESVSHKITAGGLHQTSYTLSDTAGFSGFWVLGSSALGRDTRLTY